MTKYRIICDKCEKDIEGTYVHIDPKPCCCEEENALLISSLSKPLDFCLDCWKECKTKN